VLRHRMMWRGGIDNMLYWWCVRSWDEIKMIHQSMPNDLRVADQLYMKRGLLLVENSLFVSHYWYACIAKQVTTLQNSFDPGLVLISLIQTSSSSFSCS
jgi:hypothetical protein